ncbi:MAG: tRNA (guanosine(37)-N1)-methyltransferase TrmD [Clostridiales bacterium]|nr:tRNA (guanosine(37)-N1)-methyltransferase TrmD [Clostridiales bacterium]
MKITILTIFPEMFSAVFNNSMLKLACEKGLLAVDVIDIREYTKDKHKKVDDTPFGGGAGMVMMAQPVFDALKKVKSKGQGLIYMSPKGKVIDEEYLRALSKRDEITILCGHYEGVDQRILDYFKAEEVSIGDYVLTGGELPAMVLIDSMARFIEGVLKGNESVEEESLYMGLLEYPHYTKPREYEGLKVPEVLFSGNHEEIEDWKFEESLRLTKKRRPDLFERYLEDYEMHLSKAKKKIVEKIRNES